MLYLASNPNANAYDVQMALRLTGEQKATVTTYVASFRRRTLGANRGNSTSSPVTRERIRMLRAKIRELQSELHQLMGDQP